jgi:hypothetical protein
VVAGIGDEIGWWCPSLDNAAVGSASLNDLSGNGVTCALTSLNPATAWVTDTAYEGTRAIEFDGISGYGDMGQVAAYRFGAASPMTISMWARFANVSSAPILSYSKSSILASYYVTWFRDSPASSIGPNAALADYFNGSQFHSKRAFPLVHSTWYHLVLMRDGSNTSNGHTLWVNGANVGVLRSGDSGSGAILSIDYSNARFLLARRLGQGYGAIRIDDVRVFARALSAAEIGQLASRRAYHIPSLAKLRKQAAAWYFSQRGGGL